MKNKVLCDQYAYAKFAFIQSKMFLINDSERSANYGNMERIKDTYLAAGFFIIDQC